MKAINMRALTKNYGSVRGVSDITLAVEQGEIYGFIGPNGAGKSTAIKLLLNLIYPTGGSGEIFAMNVVTQSVEIKKILGYVPSEVRYYPFLTGKELMELTLAFHNSKDSSAIDRLCEKLDIEKNKKIGTLSLGNKKKIAIACALIHEPKLIILDEPTAGLDPLIQKRLFQLLKEHHQKGATIFMSSHNLNEVQEHCTKVAFIKEGQILKVQALGKERITAKVVTITGDQIQPPSFEASGVTVLSLERNTLKFTYQGPLPPLTDWIARVQPSDITIENYSLEDEFSSYYERGQGV